MNSYLLALGRNIPLSLAELKGRATIDFIDEKAGYALASKLEFKNPRGLPKAAEQLFLDQLGGTIFIAEVLGEFGSQKDLEHIIKKCVVEGAFEKLGISTFSVGKNFLPKLLGHLKDWSYENDYKLRLENFKNQSVTSGQIFERRMTQKGLVLVVAQAGNQYLLARVVANQNLRNYKLRDRNKNFRDSKMGMLPPKLAQILVNLVVCEPGEKTTVLDPFCGSGTVNIEAAILGCQTKGSDINSYFVSQSEENFMQMAEKFRYPQVTGTFDTQDVVHLDWSKLSENCVVATEGWLGENFEKRPSRKDIDENVRLVSEMWSKVFANLAVHPIQRMAFCLPAWNFQREKISIFSLLKPEIEKAGFMVKPLSERAETIYYEREKAFVAREIVLIERKPL